MVQGSEVGKGLLQRLGGDVRVKPGQRPAQAPFQQYLAVVAALGLGFSGSDGRAEFDSIT
jgi:hypothetical protein